MKLVSQINEGLHKGCEGEDEGGRSRDGGCVVKCKCGEMTLERYRLLSLFTTVLRIRYNLPSGSIVQRHHYNQSIRRPCHKVIRDEL